MIFGVGINDAEYSVTWTEGGIRRICPYYQRWRNMLKRCYHAKTHVLQPNYRECEVCNSWKTFSNFKLWMENQDWRGKELDKDLLGDGTLYSPDTCCFLPCWLNVLESKSGTGVSKTKTGFRAELVLGTFTTESEALDFYVRYKTKLLEERLANYPDSIREAILKEHGQS